MSARSATSVQRGPGLKRAMRVLRALAAAPESGLRLSDVAAATDFGKSTTHRLLSGLTEVGLVEQDMDNRRYHLGFELYVLGQAAAGRFGILAIAKDSLQRLAERTEDTVYLSVLAGMDAVCLARVEGAFPIKTLTMNVGDRRPLPVGSGALSMLAIHADDEIESILEANTGRCRAYYFFDMAAVHAMIEQTRRDGYCFSDKRDRRHAGHCRADPRSRSLAGCRHHGERHQRPHEGRTTHQHRPPNTRREVQRITERVWPQTDNRRASRAHP